MLRILLTILALMFAAAPAAAEGLAWRVSGADGAALYLVGTVHAARPDFYPLPASVTEGFEASDVLVMEVDMSRVEPGAAARFMREHGTLDDGTTLESLLGDEDWQRVVEWGRRAGVPSGRLWTMQPWLATVTLVSLEMHRIGLDPALGLERHFSAQADARDMPIEELETLDEQLKALSGLSRATQLAFLRQSLTTPEEFEAAVEEIVDAWQAGDAEAMARILSESYAGAEEVYDALMHDRNHRWLPALERMLAGERVHFVAVGALHLVGEDGLLALLKARGYSVERL